MTEAAMVDPFEDLEDDGLADSDGHWPINEEIEETRERWKIENDSQADWALRKIAQLDEDDRKWEEHFKEELSRILKANERRRTYWIFLLGEYFRTVPHKATKTQESYPLPSGKLILKNKGPKYELDDEVLLSWLKKNNQDAFVKVKESPKWGDFKKTLPKGEDGNLATIKTEDGTRLVNADGEIIPGVSVEPQEPEFSYQLAKE